MMVRSGTALTWRCIPSSMSLMNMSIAKRLSLAFGLVLMLFAGTTLFAIAKIRALEADMKMAIHANGAVASQAAKMRDRVNGAYASLLMMTMATVKEDVTVQGELVKASLAAYAREKSALLKMSMSHDGGDIVGMPDALKALASSEEVQTSVLSLLGNLETATMGLSGQDTVEPDLLAQENAMYGIGGQVSEWVKVTSQLVDLTEQAGARSARDARAAAELARTVLMIAALTALLVSAVAAWAIARSVTRPLGRAVIAAERVALGDLSQKIDSSSADETGALLDALSRMQQNLHRLVGDVLDAARSIELASGEVASGNSDLARRTEITASNLQRIAGSMDGLTGLVVQTAESAQATTVLAASAMTAAEQGGAVVAHVVRNMQEIASESTRIAEITAIIDNIAFQTNILALNAAVEAAQAGDNGRGFAVVAEEVRHLAQRSAAAAKDIRLLIDASVQKVASGGQLVDEAGRCMSKIVSLVGQVTATIYDISKSADRQGGGIHAVGVAIGDLDRMTQQNAAMVEQSAAASEALRSQSQRLSQLVGAFKLEG